VFKPKYDGVLKFALKNDLEVADTLDDSTLRARWEAVEAKSAAVTSMASAVSGSASQLVLEESEVGDRELIAMSELFGVEQLTSF